MSVTKTEVFCDTSENQWGQDSSPNVPQTVMESDLYELSPLNQPPNVSPPAYQPPNGLGVNGANGINYIPNNVNGSYDRSAANLPNGILHGMRTLNIPNGLNGNPMLRPNGMNMVPNVNGYVNAANQRFLVRPPGWATSAKPISGVKKQKRNRTAFTSQQMMELEQEYARTRYLDRTRRIELSEILHLNERTIKIWFQNRRMKEKKDRAESLEDSEEVSTTGSSPELGMSGNVPMPMLLPTTVTNEAYGRGMYVDYQQAPSQMVPMPPLMPNPMGDYPGYIPAEDYEAQCRLGHIQMQQYPPMYNELQEVPAEPSTSHPEGTPVTAPASEQNWDLSWIRSMQVEDDF